MERTRGVQDEIGTAPLGVAAAAVDGEEHTESGGPCGLDSETATLLLRRCTALAARARVDLLSPGRCGAAEELGDVLTRMRSWEPSARDLPDPTMTVLAAAALQDLAERLRRADQQGEPSPSWLATSIDAALSVLQGIMAGGRVDVPA